MAGRLWRLFAILTLLQSLDAQSVADGILHPCRQQRPNVKAGGRFVLGFAFWPNDADRDAQWGAPDSGPHPCAEDDRETLVSHNVAVSYFNVQVDKLTLVDSVNQLQERFADTLDNVTVVAFSGGYRSEAKVVSLRDGDDWLIVRSLALIAKFGDKGLEQFQWFDLNCGECEQGDICRDLDDHTSCVSVCDLSHREACRSEIYVSFDGVDKNNQVLNSATQIRRLRRGSISHLYQSGRDLATNAVDQI